MIFSAGGKGGPVQVRVFDVTGRLVKTLIDQLVAPGTQAVDWDGRNDRGHKVAPGLYFVRMVSGPRTWQKTVVVLR